QFRLNKWLLVQIGAVSTITVIIYRLVKKQRQAEYTKNVLFFPDSHIPCRKYLLSPIGCTKNDCRLSHNEKSSFIKLMRYILNAQKSLKLCMFSITCDELAQAVTTKYRQGVVVKVVTDTEYMNLNGSKMHGFLKQGIEIRHDRSSYLMHHKFVVIDEKIVVTGSFNWTHAAVVGNTENVLVTNNPEIVRPYLNEFTNLWEKY
uniref:Mitochondrial cardiolipin hydrolase n=1 Tax=Ciona intestinalis TaxID=7719 RepID=H2Y076_CIOIN